MIKPFLSSLCPALAPLAILLVAATLAAAFAYPFSLLTAGRIPFHSLVSRSALLLLLASALLIMRQQRLTGADIGFIDSASLFFHQLSRGFGYGLIMLGLQVFMLLALDLRTLDLTPMASANELGSTLLKASLTASLVALIEEPLFRGILLQSLLRRTGRIYAIVVSSVYYAGLHFLHSNIKLKAHAVNWYSGFTVELDAFQQLFDMRNVDSFLALFTVGVFLSGLRTALPKGLGYCIGLHAGWVFIIKFTKAISHDNPHSPWSFLTGSYDGIIGYLTAGWIGVLAIAMFYRHPRKEESQIHE